MNVKNLFLLISISFLLVQCGKKESENSANVTPSVHSSSPLFEYRTDRIVYTVGTDSSGNTTVSPTTLAANSVDFGFNIVNGSSKTLVIAGVTVEFQGSYKGAVAKTDPQALDFAKTCAGVSSTITNPALLRSYYAVIPPGVTFIGYTADTSSCVHFIDAGTSNSPELITMYNLPKIDDNTGYRVKVKMDGWFADTPTSSTNSACTTNSSGFPVGNCFGGPSENFSKTFTFITTR